MDRDAEVYQYSDIAKVVDDEPPRYVKCLKSQQNLLVAKIDIYEVAKIFTDNVLFSGDFVFEEEQEIDLSHW